MKVLFADDDKVIQKMMVYNLVKYDHEVTTVENGKEAIDALKEETFDLIILDVLMPKLSGIEVLEFIRSEVSSKLPVIMMSRDNHYKTIKKAKEEGANEYITKPFAPEELYLKIKKLTGHTAG